MLRRLIFALILFGSIVVVYFSFADWRSDRAMLNGEVNGVPNDASHPEDETSDSTSSKAFTPKSPETSPATPPDTTTSVARPAEPIPSGEPSPAAPTTDTIGPNPPNGTVFAGTGRYQVYRQGNLTWRLDTNTGKTCVLFATLEEWKNPLVYRHGCGPSAQQ